MSSPVTSTCITELPLDVLSHVCDYLPLSQVLRCMSLVSKTFYVAHRQHCRSTKQLTLIGHHMVEEGGNSLRRCTTNNVVPQSDAERNRQLLSFARFTGSPSSPPINPSSVHLKLVSGQEETAYAAIGDKFKSITHLELYQLPLERHYKHIAKMISGSPNMLVDLKVFFSLELYSSKGVALSRRNNSACIAYLLAEALTPTKAPSLRKLTMTPIDLCVEWGDLASNHNKYRGPQLRQIDLSQVEVLQAEHFETYLVPPLTALRELTIDLRRDLNLNGVLHQICKLKIYLEWSFPNNSTFLATVLGGNSKVCKLELSGSSLSRHELVRLLCTASTANNDNLKDLRVDFTWFYYSPVRIPTESISITFTALTTLHLGKSRLLHFKSDIKVFSKLFPNVVHLRLDNNFNPKYSSRKTDLPNPNGKIFCVHCREYILSTVNRKRFRDIQKIRSSTASVCKASFVRRALAAWPKLTRITLQIEDFYEKDLPEEGTNVKYLFMSESILLRDAASKLMPNQKWTVEKVFF